jgi:membrane associated rhomboid family serine protease
MWLHADLAHLATNATLGFVFLGLAMGRFGTGPGLLSAYLAGAGGNIVAWIVSSASVASLGASGMVSGALGILAIQSLNLRGKTPHAGKYIVAGAMAGIMLFVLVGLNPTSYVQAHLGGFASGLLLGATLIFLPDFSRNPAANLGCGAIFTLLVLFPWWMALSR